MKNIKNELNIKERIELLKEIKRRIIKCEDEIALALREDLNKGYTEAYLSEIMIVKHEISYLIKYLKKFFKVKREKTPIYLYPSRSYVYKRPHGNVLILSPWNYPFQLSMNPAVAALACGNSVVLKLSSKVKATSNVVSRIFKGIAEIYVCGNEDYDEILSENYDFIFFTGSGSVGKQIMDRAKELMCPVVLELGGKSPCIVDKNCDIKLSAKRIAFSKLMNSGQTCVAPDYILLHEDIKDEFILYLQKELETQTKSKQDVGELVKIISADKVKDIKEKLSGIASDDCFDPENRYIKPMCIEASWDSPIMQDEIFAPILPYITYRNTDEIIKKINSYDTPLALYLFTNDEELREKILSKVKFGGGVFNDCLNHIANVNLPFGGQRHSGIGRYHGEASLRTFTVETSIVKSTFKFDMKLKYKPMSKLMLKLFKKIV